jgi:hypothetical protein
MLREYSWFQPRPRNFSVSSRNRREWRNRAAYNCQTDEYELLREIELAKRNADEQLSDDVRRRYWLLPYRDRFRAIIHSHHGNSLSGVDVGAIQYYMAYCPPSMIPICAWLIGRCSSRYRLFGLAELSRGSSRQVRKHLAKALWRLEAWHLLDEMASRYPHDEKVQWYASSVTVHRGFDERLKNYLADVDDSHADEVITPSQMPFWALQTSWDVTPPKSVAAIRRILERIRHWVRWGVT